jgi:TonB family protein
MRWLRELLLSVLVVPLAGAQQPQSSPEPAEAGKVISSEHLTRPPSVKHFVEAAYPPEAEAAGLTATVMLQVDISETGVVTNATVLEPAGHGFDKAAVEALRRFEFEPAEIDGKPAAVRITYNYHFVLRPKEPQPGATVASPGQLNLLGRVLERGTRRPVAAADVVLPDGQTATTDERGEFAFRDLPVGSIRVSVLAAEYQAFETAEVISAGQQTRVTYYVTPRLFNQYETIIRAPRPRKEVSETTLSLEEVQRIPGTLGDSLKVVQNLPGVARPPFNGGAIIIRGTSTNDSGIYLDGERIPLLYHFGGLTSVYNSDLLEAVDYLPGNYSVYYGDQIGGVVDVRSRSPRTDGFHGYANINLLDTSVELEGPLTKGLSIAFAARRSYIDAILNLTGLASNFNVAPRYLDAQLKLEWRLTPHQTLTFLTVTDDDKLELIIDRPANNDPTVAGNFKVHTGFTQFRLRHLYRNGPFRLETTGMIGPSTISAVIGSERSLNVDNHEYDLRSTAEYEWASWLTSAAGIDLVYQRAWVGANLERPPREGEPQIPGVLREKSNIGRNLQYYFPSAWAELRLRPIPRLLIVPGLRSESYRYTDQTTPDRSLNPRLGVRFDLTDRLTLKGGAGLNHGPAQQGEPTVEFGNPEIRARRSVQTSLGAEMRFTPEIFGSVEGFYNHLSQLPTASTSSGAPYLVNDGVGNAYGLEFLLRHSLTRRFFGWVAYTLSRSERRNHPGDPLRLFTQDQTQVLTAIASYKLPRNWQIGGRFRFASGNNVTPVIGARRNDNVDVFAPIYGAINSERLPSFNQLDIRVDKTWVFDLWSLDLFLDVQNVYNRRSVEGVTYSYNYVQRQYFTGLPILPIIGVKGSF